jgi:hypothetical protein
MGGSIPLTIGGVTVPLAVLVEGVADNEAPIEALLIGIRPLANTIEDGSDTEGRRRRHFLTRQVDRSDDAGHSPQGIVSQLVLVDQRFKGAAAPMVT